MVASASPPGFVGNMLAAGRRAGSVSVARGSGDSGEAIGGGDFGKVDSADCGVGKADLRRRRFDGRP